MIVWFDAAAIERVTTKTDARTAIASLSAIIDTLISAATVAAVATNDTITEYKYDDHQTRTYVKREYRDVAAITAQIRDLQALQQVFLQMPGMNNRVIRLMDGKNFIGFNYNL